MKSGSSTIGSAAERLVILLLCLAIIIPVTPVSVSAPPWFIGNRQVPGPLPPNLVARPPIDAQIGIVYGVKGGVNLLLDFAKPQLCRNQKVPLVAFIHGGGWFSGSRLGMINSGDANMYYQCGIAFASIGYRFAPTYTYKDIIGDCKLAIRYLRENADRLGIDPDRIAVWGPSAGGHLVSILGTADEDDGLEGPGLEGVSSRVSAVANDCGVSDLSTPWAPPGSFPMNCLTMFLGCYPTACPDKAKEASPLTYVTPDDSTILTIHGELDSIVDFSQALKFNKALKEAGNRGAFIGIVNGEHSLGPYAPGVVAVPNFARIRMLRFYHLIRHIEPGVLCDLNVDGMVNGTDSAELDSLLGVYGINSGGLPTTPLWNTQADTFPDGRIDYKDWQTFSKVKAIPPKFTLEITPASQTVSSKESITFKVVVRNLGQLDIHDYTLSFGPSPGLVFKSSSEPVTQGQAVTYSNPLLPAFQAKNLVLTYRLSPGLAISQNGLTLTCNARFTSPVDTLLIEASAKIGVPSLSVRLASSALKAQAGDKLTFTAIVSNRSPHGVTGAMLWVDLPEGITFLSSQPSGTKQGSKVMFVVGNIAAGGLTTFRIFAQIAKDIDPGGLAVAVGASSDEVHEVSGQAMVQIITGSPGSNPQIVAAWSGLDTGSSTGSVGQAITVRISVIEGSSPYKVSIDWGNGVRQTSNLKNDEVVLSENTYNSPGDREVILSCTDSVARSKIIRRLIHIR